MALTDLLSRLRLGQERDTSRSADPSRRSARCTVESLEDRTVPSTLTFAAMGDSLTTHYGGARASVGDKSWTDLFHLLRGDQISIQNVAGNGATSAGVANGQAPKVKQMVADGTVHYAVLEIGGNDENDHLAEITSGNATPFINEVVSNIERALSTVASGGQVRQVLGLLPDIGDTPAIKAELLFDKTKLARLTSAVKSANNQLLAYASAHGIVVADVYSLSKMTYKPVVLASTPTSDWWSPDNFHPSGVPQGLFANTVLRALQTAYGVRTQGLPLSDQDILNATPKAGNLKIQSPMYYDVSKLVIMPGHHASVADSFDSTSAPFYPNLTLLESHKGLPAGVSRIVAAVAASQGTIGSWSPAALPQLIPQLTPLVGLHGHWLASFPSAENLLSHKPSHPNWQTDLEFVLAADGLGELSLPQLA